MLFSYYLSVAGVSIHIESDKELVINEGFIPFITGENSADVQEIISSSEKIPCEPKEALWSDQFSSVYRTPEGKLRRFFYGGGKNDIIAAVDYNNEKSFVEVEFFGKNPDIQNCFYFLGFEEILLKSNKLCLHASCIDTNLGGILFSGISGIGKSTQADLWCEYRDARQINGDRPILSKEENCWKAWGSPYAGSSKVYVNESCEISAIVLLKQATTCSLRKLSAAEAFRGVWAGLTIHSWDAAYVEAASALAIDFITQVPVYELSCTPDENAVVCLEKALMEGVER